MEVVAGIVLKRGFGLGGGFGRSKLCVLRLLLRLTATEVVDLTAVGSFGSSVRLLSEAVRFR